MKSKKLYMFQMGLVPKIASIWINMVKVCLQIHLYKRPDNL
jgi:hypothetical protein